MEKKYAVIIQCDITHRRCSGFACTESFYNREDFFKDYPKDTRYISFTCGGCSGKSVSAKLIHFLKKLREKTDISKDEVSIHLSSCMSTDNTHFDRCPHIDYIKNIIKKRGYNDIIEGSYLSKGAERKRENGLYNVY